MTTNELKAALAATAETIKTTRQVCTDGLLDNLKKLLDKAKNDSAVRAAFVWLIGVQFDKFAEDLQKVVDVCDKVTSPVGETIIHALTKLQDRPVILKILSELL